MELLREEMKLVNDAERGGDLMTYCAQVDALMGKKMKLIHTLRAKVTATSAR